MTDWFTNGYFVVKYSFNLVQDFMIKKYKLKKKNVLDWSFTLYVVLCIYVILNHLFTLLVKSFILILIIKSLLALFFSDILICTDVWNCHLCVLIIFLSFFSFCGLWTLGVVWQRSCIHLKKSCFQLLYGTWGLCAVVTCDADCCCVVQVTIYDQSLTDSTHSKTLCIGCPLSIAFVYQVKKN